jgi:uncharacterized membrane protein YphA (DoxX/SURF4 family)
MSAPRHSGGVDFGLLLTRLVVGLYVGLAGLMKLNIFVKAESTEGADPAGPGADASEGAATQAATQPATQPATDGAADALQWPFAFQWPGFNEMGQSISGFVNNMMLPMRPPWLPEALAQAYGYAIPFLEVVLGLFIIIGLITRFSATILLLMIASFTYALATQGPGVLFPAGGGPFHPNFIILAVLLLFMFAGPGRVSLDRLFGGGRNHDEEPEVIEEEHEHYGDRPV